MNYTKYDIIEKAKTFGCIIFIVFILVATVYVFFLSEKQEEDKCKADCLGLNLEFFKLSETECSCLKDKLPLKIWGRDDTNYVPVYIPISN
jgi:hypothetical protein